MILILSVLADHITLGRRHEPRHTHAKDKPTADSYRSTKPLAHAKNIPREPLAHAKAA